MLQAILLSAGLSLGQTGNPLPAPPAPVPSVRIIRAQAGELEQLPTGPPVKVISLYSAAPEPDPRATPVTPVAHRAPEAPAAAAPLEFSVPGAPVAPAPAAAAPAAAATVPDRWLLMKSLQGTWPGQGLDGTRTSIYGWIEGSATASSVGHNDLPESFNYRGNEPMLQQAWFRVARSVVTSGTTTPTFGFQSDWIVGSDYRFTLPRGIFNEQLTDRHGLFPNIYGVDPVQFYGEAYFPTVCRGLDVKVGRFYTPYGVESLEAVSTPLLSHSYVFSNGSPFTHTGILGTLTLTPIWTVQAGIVLGSDVFFDSAVTPTFVGSVQWTQPATGSTPRNIVKATTVFGHGRFDPNEGYSGVVQGFNNINIFDVVWTHNFNPVLVHNLEMLYGYESNVADNLLGGLTSDPRFINWAGVVSYTSFTFSPRLVGTMRLELFDDPQGFRTTTAAEELVVPTQTKGLYSAITLGALFKLTDPITSTKGSVILVPELRYDYCSDSRPFGTREHGLLTAGLGLITRW